MRHGFDEVRQWQLSHQSRLLLRQDQIEFPVIHAVVTGQQTLSVLPGPASRWPMSLRKTPYGLLRQLSSIAAALVVMQVTYFFLVKAAEYGVGLNWFQANLYVVVFMLLTVVLGVVAWELASQNSGQRHLLALRPGLQLLSFSVSIVGLLGIAIGSTSGLGVTLTVPQFRIWTGPALAELASIYCNALREEIFYRYFLFGVFAKLTRSVPIGLLLATTVFTLGHSTEIALFIFSVGLFLSAIVLRTGSIWVSTAAHFARRFQA